MHPFINIFGKTVGTYGVMIGLGIVLDVLLLWALSGRLRYEMEDIMVMGGYGLLAGFFGAKLLYILISLPDMEWDRLGDPAYLLDFLLGGFVFYGGLICALIALFICRKLHRIPVYEIMTKAAYVIPFGHAFGRIGCFMAGCCYGVPYDGPFAVVFPPESFGLSGLSLFPVQLLEAGLLFLLGIIILILCFQRKRYTLELYLILYALVRFFTETLRYDEYRGKFLCFYTSQWISILMLLSGGLLILLRSRREKQRGREETAV